MPACALAPPWHLPLYTAPSLTALAAQPLSLAAPSALPHDASPDNTPSAPPQTAEACPFRTATVGAAARHPRAAALHLPI